MNILIIYQGEFPDNERIEKEAVSLIRAGHSVFLLCNNYGRFERDEELLDGLHVYRLKPYLRQRKLAKILKFPLFANPLWLYQIARLIRRHRIDVLHVVDIPLALGAVLLGRLTGRPILLDMWENYPEALKGWVHIHWTYRVFKNPTVARWVEQITVRLADHILVVVEEQKERFISEGIPAGRVSVVSNTVDLASFQPPATTTAADGRFTLLYVGGITAERGLEDMIRAVKIAAEGIPGLRLIIAGRGHSEDSLKALARRENVADRVEFPGWIAFKDIPAWIQCSDLCLIPHVYNEFINTTIPNKLFQYMALGKPVLVSHAKPLARIVREADCGFVYQSGHAEDAAAQILQAYRADRKALGENGRRLAVSKYNWAMTETELLRVYATFNPQTDNP